jgi:pyruvate ferredoxin oxidoreductase delta subunit
MRIAIGAVVEGGTSVGYQTGNWREGKKPIIDQDLCKQCGICELYCPDSAVRVEDDRYVIDLNYCKGCGICEYECPADAIRMVDEEK